MVRGQKNIMNRNLQINLTLVILTLIAVVLGCGDGENTSAETPEKKIPAAYVGMWTGQDGSTLTIRNDGSGDFKSGGTSMSGASVEVDEAAKEIRFSLLLIDSKYRIDEPPKGNKMKLDGMEYRRTGGFDTSGRETVETAEIPSEDELRPLVYNSLVNFNQAIQSGDFTEFHKTISEKWQSQTSVATFNEAFASSIKNKNNYTPKSEESLDFTTPPLIEDKEYLAVTVRYITVKGMTPRFRLDYLRENGEWKLFGVQMNPKQVEK